MCALCCGEPCSRNVLARQRAQALRGRTLAADSLPAVSAFVHSYVQPNLGDISMVHALLSGMSTGVLGVCVCEGVRVYNAEGLLEHVHIPGC